jgi:hypothetical protein
MTICKSHWLEKKAVGFENFGAGEKNEWVYHMASELHAKHLSEKEKARKEVWKADKQKQMCLKTASAISHADSL